MSDRAGEESVAVMANSNAVEDLIARSNRLGADPRNTNYAGGNTSAKGQDADPVTGEPVELMWVKGSGGDLGTLTEQGLAVLRLDRLHTLSGVYPGVDREDEMVAAFDYTLHGKGGAAPSIDTAMHGLVDADHVDHLHPDSGIAIATAADGPELTREIFGGKVVWVPWRRPGWQLGQDIAEIKRSHPEAIGTVLGGHGITAWGASSDECERNSRWIINTAAEHIHAHGRPEPFGAVLDGYEPLPEQQRRARAAALAPVLRGLVSTDKRQVGHFTDGPEVLEFLARAEHPRLAELGTSCPDHFLRTKVKPLVLDLPATASVEESVQRLKELHAQYREDYAAYYRRHADPDSPPMRGADPAIVLIPGVGMFSYGGDKQTARVAGEFYVNAINVMRGAEALSTYSPSTSGRSSASSTGRWRRRNCADARRRSRWRRRSHWSPGRPPASARPPPPASPATGPTWCSPTSTRPKPGKPRPNSVRRTWPWASVRTSPTRVPWPPPSTRRCSRSAESTWW